LTGEPESKLKVILLVASAICVRGTLVNFTVASEEELVALFPNPNFITSDGPFSDIPFFPVPVKRNLYLAEVTDGETSAYIVTQFRIDDGLIGISVVNRGY